MNKLLPEVGSWYKELQQGIMFEVVAVDDSAQTIETQMSDGAITEYDMESWQEMLLETIEEPEDWRAGYELSDEDYIDSGDTLRPEEWSSPVNLIETDIINGLLDEI